MSTRSFTQDGDRGLKIHAGLKSILGLAVLAHTLVTGADASNCVAVPQQVVAREAWEDGNALLLSDFCEPGAHLAERDDGLVMVDELGR